MFNPLKLFKRQKPTLWYWISMDDIPDDKYTVFSKEVGGMWYRITTKDDNIYGTYIDRHGFYDELFNDVDFPLVKFRWKTTDGIISSAVVYPKGLWFICQHIPIYGWLWSIYRQDVGMAQMIRFHMGLRLWFDINAAYESTLHIEEARQLQSFVNKHKQAIFDQFEDYLVRQYKIKTQVKAYV